MPFHHIICIKQKRNKRRTKRVREREEKEHSWTLKKKTSRVDAMGFRLWMRLLAIKVGSTCTLNLYLNPLSSLVHSSGRSLFSHLCVTLARSVPFAATVRTNRINKKWVAVAQLHFHAHKMAQLLSRLNAIVIFFHYIIVIFSVFCPIHAQYCHPLTHSLIHSFSYSLRLLLSPGPTLFPVDRLFIFQLENSI